MKEFTEKYIPMTMPKAGAETTASLMSERPVFTS